MKKIGILSDTHSYWDEKYLHYFEPCDEIWHAGDIGSLELRSLLPSVRCVPSAATATVATCDACIPSGYAGSARTSTC